MKRVLWYLVLIKAGAAGVLFMFWDQISELVHKALAIIERVA